MKIEIQNFRCHENLVLEFPDSQISNLSGESGLGKSTVFEAIFWCLFHSNNTKIKSDKSVKNILVCLRLPGIIVTRTSTPCTLAVIINGIEYRDEAAQEKININFGNMEFFEVCSYNSQNTRNIFLNAKNENRLKIIEVFSALDASREQTIKKIETMAKNYEKQNNFGNLEIEKKILDEKKIRNNWKSWTPEEKEKTKIKLNILKNESLMIQEKIKQNNILIGRKAILETQLTKKYENKESEIENLNIEIEKTTRLLKIKKLGNIDIEEFLKYEKVSENEVRYNDQRISEYNRCIEICRKNNLNYSKESIVSEIEKLETGINENYNRIIARDMRELGPLAIEQEDIDKMKKEISDIEVSMNNMNCPHCNKNVRLVGRILIPVDTCTNREKELPDLKKKLIQLEEMMRQKKRIEEFVSKNKSIFDYPLPINKDEYEKRLKEIRTVNISKSPKETALLEKIFLFQSIENVKHEDILESEKTTNNDLNVLKEKLNQALKNQVNYETGLKNHEEIKAELEKIVIVGNLEEKIISINAEIETLENAINSWKIFDIIDNDQRLLDQKIENENMIERKIKACKVLRTSALEVERTLLQGTLNMINGNINHVLKMLFDDPISVEFKIETKIGDSSIRQQVNEEVKHKRMSYTDINKMSGGEGDRISLAILLAFAKLSPCPFILLDESLRALDIENRERFVKALKKIKDKTVICTDHAATEGLYDFVCDTLENQERNNTKNDITPVVIKKGRTPKKT